MKIDSYFIFHKAERERAAIRLLARASHARSSRRSNRGTSVFRLGRASHSVRKPLFPSFCRCERTRAARGRGRRAARFRQSAAVARASGLQSLRNARFAYPHDVWPRGGEARRSGERRPSTNAAVQEDEITISNSHEFRAHARGEKSGIFHIGPKNP